jgi:hypothetical protein
MSLAFFGTAEAGEITQKVKDSCAADYRKYCKDYGLETSGLRLCMDKNGQKLSKACVNALVAQGEVSQNEVDRRKKSGH